MAQVDLSLLAQDDLQDIWLYIAADSQVAANHQAKKIFETLRKLAKFPLLGEELDHHRSGLRRHVIGNYLVFYEQIPGGIRVIRVLHGARRWEDEVLD